jgi:hypothetical protein
MSRRIINVGSAPLAGDGEQLRDAFVKINDNFEEIYVAVDNIVIPDVSNFITADDIPVIPTDVSEFTNDAGYLTSYTETDTLDTVTERNATTTNAITVGGLTSTGILKIDVGAQEKYQTINGATGTVTHDCSLGHIFYHTSPSSNWTVNLTNLNLATTYATAITLIIEQGSTGFYPSALTIAGSAQGTINIRWQGGIIPTPSTDAVDVVTFSIINDSNLYTALGQLTGF